MDFDAVVLAGGAGTRLGGIDKAGLEVGGISLLDRVLLASSAARRTVVVGVPRPATRAVEWTLEQPPGGGPLAGLAAGVAVLEAAGPALVLVLATDLPRLRAVDVDRLVTALADAEPHVEAAIFVDRSGRPQPLTAVYRRAQLVSAIAEQQPVAGRSMWSMLRRLTVAEVPDEGASADIDTPAQLTAAQERDRDHERHSRNGEPLVLDQNVTDWVVTLCQANGIDPKVVDIAAVLDLAKDAAHGVARPAAPLTTFVAGYLAGRASSSATGSVATGDVAAVTRAVLAEIGALIPPPPTLD